MDLLTHIPDGLQDGFGPSAARRVALENRLLEQLATRGFERILPPPFEFSAVFEVEGSDDTQSAVRFFDAAGRVLSLPVDATLPAARLAATRLADAPLPLRLCYNATTVTQHEGTFCACPQVGAELFGAEGEGDVQALHTAAECLTAAGLEGFVLDIGQVGFLLGLLEQSGLDPDAREAVRQAVERKDMLELDLLLRDHTQLRRSLLHLPKLYGRAEVFAQAQELSDHPTCLAALADAKRLFDALSDLGWGDRLRVDFGLVPSLGYYTGLVFRGFAPGVGSALLSGGRYDSLTARYGRNLSASGFCLRLPELMQAVEYAGTKEANV